MKRKRPLDARVEERCMMTEPLGAIVLQSKSFARWPAPTPAPRRGKMFLQYFHSQY